MDIETFIGSKEVYGPEVDLFNMPPTNISIVKSDYQKLNPMATPKDNTGPVEFHIFRSNSFLDLNETFLYVQARILKQDGTALSKTDLVAPGNLFLHTLFQDVKVKFNDTLVTGSNSMYPYLAWFKNQLKASSGLKESKLSKEIYYKDTDPDDYSVKNPGFQKRLALATESKRFEMIGKFSSPLFDLQRYIPNNVDVHIELARSNPNFCLSASNSTGLENNFRVELDDVQLYLKRRVLEPSIYRTIQQKFTKGKKAVYPVLQSRMSTSQIIKGALSHTNSGLFNGPLPQSLILGIVSSQAYSGTLNHSPFNFKHNNLSRLVVTVNGQPTLYNTIDCNYKQGEYLVAYNTLFGGFSSAGGNGISMEEYLLGNTLYAYELGNSLTSNLQGELTGTVGVEIFFSEPLEEPQTLVVMGQFQELIEIDKNGRVEVSN